MTVDRGLAAVAALLALVALAVVLRGVSRPEIAPPVPFGAETPATRRLPPARPVPRAPRGPRPDLAPRPDGLVAWDAVPGQGEPLEDGLLGVFEYTGWLPDGTSFDSSYERAGPVRFRLGARKVLPGWDVGLAGMREGGVRQLVVPPALAYGERGVPGRIPPGVALTYDLELLEVIDVPATPAPVDAWTPLHGLEVHDLVVGDGAPVEAGRTVVADYVVWVRGGARIDTSYERAGPFTFRHGEGAVAWEAGLEGASAGGRRQIVVPPALAFGEEGRPPVVPPGATLVVEVEVREVK